MPGAIDVIRKETPHYSYSAFNTYLQCPLKYRFRYIDKVAEEKTCSCLPFGRAIHAALSERARSGSSFNNDAAKLYFAEFFDAEVKTTDNLVYKDGETFNSMVEQGNRMLDVALENWDFDYEVKSVAEAFSVKIPGLSKPLIGEFDMVVEGNGNEPCIVDWKTASSKWAMGKVECDLQATAFSYAYRELNGTTPVFRFDVITKTKTPTLNSYFTVRAQDELTRFESLVQLLDKAICTGNFYPNEDIIHCAGCPYRDHCKRAYWR